MNDLIRGPVSSCSWWYGSLDLSLNCDNPSALWTLPGSACSRDSGTLRMHTNNFTLSANHQVGTVRSIADVAEGIVGLAVFIVAFHTFIINEAVIIIIFILAIVVSIKVISIDSLLSVLNLLHLLFALRVNVGNLVESLYAERTGV